MFKAYFYENRTISDDDVIAAIAGEAGLDTIDFATKFVENSDPGAAERPIQRPRRQQRSLFQFLDTGFGPDRHSNSQSTYGNLLMDRSPHLVFHTIVTSPRPTHLRHKRVASLGSTF